MLHQRWREREEQQRREREQHGAQKWRAGARRGARTLFSRAGAGVGAR